MPFLQNQSTVQLVSLITKAKFYAAVEKLVLQNVQKVAVSMQGYISHDYVILHVDD